MIYAGRPYRAAGFRLSKKSLDFFDSLKNFFDFIEKVSDCTRKGGSPPPFHTFPPLPVQRIFSFFDTPKPAARIGRPAFLWLRAVPGPDQLNGLLARQVFHRQL